MAKKTKETKRTIKTVGVSLKFGVVVYVECVGDPTKEQIADAVNLMEREGEMELGPFDEDDIINYSIEDENEAMD